MDFNMEGFKCLPVVIEKNTSIPHYLWIKKQQVRVDNEFKPNDRTLFCVNVPPFIQHKWMEKFFSACGTVEQIFFHQKPTAASCNEENALIRTYKVSYVVFENPTGLEMALLLPQNEPICMPFEGTLSGRTKRQYLSTFPCCRPIVLKEMVDKFMKEYDKKVFEEKQKAKEAEGVPDEDGWITVTKKKNTVILANESDNKKFSFKQKKKRAEKELLHFYTFQKRDSKMEHLSQLRKKFQEDKERGALMRASRKFKPY